MEKIDEVRLADHLARINRDELSRRTGAILDLIGMKSDDTPLGNQLRMVKNRVSGETTEIPLLPGMDFPNRSDAWRVSVP